jgi:uncharacterized protein (TIGR02246 family)
MFRIALVIAFLAGLATPVLAQKTEIEAVNAKWLDFFNKGDFAEVASLYTEDATAFPPGSGMVKGRAAIEAMWKGMAEKIGDPKVTTLDVKPLGPSAAREIGTFSLTTKDAKRQVVASRALAFHCPSAAPRGPCEKQGYEPTIRCTHRLCRSECNNGLGECRSAA